MIPFNRLAVVGQEQQYIEEAIQKGQLHGDGMFTDQCEKWLEKHTGSYRVLLTTSCTHALEMAAVLLDIQPGDEVIMPSYTFTSTANAFALRGARLVFIDIRPDTMNLDEQKLERAINSKTKAIIVVHYAGVACEMADVMGIAKKHDLYVVEDAAQGVMSQYMKKPLGSIGHLGCFSFHETKNYTSGEGGALLINDETLAERAEIIREKGTNRRQFLQGTVDKYSWVDVGSSYLPSELNAAYLLAQLDQAETINEKRLKSWNRYYGTLSKWRDEGRIELPQVPEYCDHNAHMFYIKVRDSFERQRLMAKLKTAGIASAFHYIPLHTSVAGQRFGVFHGEDRFTTTESERLLRLPMYYGLEAEQIDYIAEQVGTFYADG